MCVVLCCLIVCVVCLVLCLVLYLCIVLFCVFLSCVVLSRFVLSCLVSWFCCVLCCALRSIVLCAVLSCLVCCVVLRCCVALCLVCHGGGGVWFLGIVFRLLRFLYICIRIEPYKSTASRPEPYARYIYKYGTHQIISANFVRTVPGARQLILMPALPSSGASALQRAITAALDTP